MTNVILQAYTRTGVSHRQHRKKLGEVLEKNAGEWTRRVEIRKKSLAVSTACVAIYTDLLQAGGTLISASAAPHWGSKTREWHSITDTGKLWHEV